MLVVENQHDTKDCPYELLFYPLKMLLTGGAVEFSIRDFFIFTLLVKIKKEMGVRGTAPKSPPAGVFVRGRAHGFEPVVLALQLGLESFIFSEGAESLWEKNY